jgi:type II secretion system protein G
MKRNRKGFTLIELLIVVAIIGIIVAIAIPNLLNAIQRAKQKRTMGDMRSIGTAAEAYSIDYNAYPPSAAGSIPVLYGGITYPTDFSHTVGSKLQTYVSPTYIRVMPLKDGWGNAIIYTTNASNQDYGIVSAAKDGALASPATSGPTSNFNTDIVFSDGQFTVYPEGVQQ